MTGSTVFDACHNASPEVAPVGQIARDHVLARHSAGRPSTVMKVRGLAK
jgi:hypothetical protein